MEAKLSLNGKCLSSIRLGRNLTHKPKSSPIVLAVLTRPRDNKTTTDTTSVYTDNWFDRIAINYLSQSLQITTVKKTLKKSCKKISGMKNEKSGYESLVDATTQLSRNFNTNKQQELVIQSLQKTIPQFIPSMVRKLFPPSKFTREQFAVFTTLFFPWLVGPCEVKESEIEGRLEKNVVHIKKCRFLEGTNCIGMCINLCKLPTQRFIKESLGMPVNMVPNFDDMSCDMIFGQDAPASSDDPALKKPCYKISCKAKQKHSSDCSSL